MSKTRAKILRKKRQKVKKLSGRVVRITPLNNNQNDVSRDRKVFVDVIEKITDSSIHLKHNRKKGFESIIYLSEVGRDFEIEEVTKQ